MISPHHSEDITIGGLSDESNMKPMRAEVWNEVDADMSR